MFRKYSFRKPFAVTSRLTMVIVPACLRSVHAGAAKGERHPRVVLGLGGTA